MNKTNFIQTGGWPLKSERLQELQTAYSIFNAYGSLAGNLTIISGCETLGTTVQDGVVYIDGELYDFKSASVTPSSTVIIIETPINRGFKNGVVKTVHTLRYATFGTAETSWPWADFKRPFPTKEIPADLNEQLETIETKESIKKVSALEARIKALENKTNFFSAELINRLLFQLQNILTVDYHLALLWSIQPAHRMHQCRLAATRFTKNRHASTVWYGQTDVI